MDGLSRGAVEQEVRRQVVETALAHHLVSKYTSLVAVEQKKSRPMAESVNNQQLTTNFPKGWKHDGVFGTTARTATGYPLMVMTGVMLFLLATILLRLSRRRVL